MPSAGSSKVNVEGRGLHIPIGGDFPPEKLFLEIRYIKIFYKASSIPMRHSQLPILNNKEILGKA